MFDFDHTGAEQVITLDGGTLRVVRQRERGSEDGEARCGVPEDHREPYALLGDCFDISSVCDIQHSISVAVGRNIQ